MRKSKGLQVIIGLGLLAAVFGKGGSGGGAGGSGGRGGGGGGGGASAAEAARASEPLTAQAQTTLKQMSRVGKFENGAFDPLNIPSITRNGQFTARGESVLRDLYTRGYIETTPLRVGQDSFGRSRPSIRLTESGLQAVRGR